MPLLITICDILAAYGYSDLLIFFKTTYFNYMTISNI